MDSGSLVFTASASWVPPTVCPAWLGVSLTKLLGPVSALLSGFFTCCTSKALPMDVQLCMDTAQQLTEPCGGRGTAGALLRTRWLGGSGVGLSPSQSDRR